ncbi:translation initiation/elongation factor MRX8 [Aspergillus clavatus NRRL 1]|uniref:GTP-binding protein 8 n=1 Tax=Aspergillus clavatus (strain ATCC 1007 / CBS 513.65 / DSM 816 / NCTC 3887 / NRRL 1 / QM 1276 / 107) TaxID=344612 RepID=A1CUE2_ASPCL|nr:GTP binding protein (EngB), putative [Aspergillus clavatus NRRL 1]EAW06929.1 GTP binding protein (EngB), putative [Aspergillus clavatus NRRL 1]
MKDRFYVCTACLRRNFSTTLSRRHISSSPAPPPPSNAQKLQLRDLSPSDLSYYWDTRVPNQAQLSYADKFFTPSRHSPVKIWSASKFRTTPLSSPEPEVAFLGRSNVGKSSLLNAIMGKEICWTSSKPGRTREMNAFGIGGTKGGESKIVLLDMPGYGKASRAEWGIEILKYLQGRRQLRRAFVLIDSLHGIKKKDKDILKLFRQYAIPHQIILSKVDKVLAKKKSQVKSGASAANVAALRSMLEDLRPVIQPDGRVEGPGALGEILTCGAETPTGPGQFLGISAIRWAILSAAGFDGGVEVKPESIPSESTEATTSAAPP